jgi:hypothetical protein
MLIILIVSAVKGGASYKHEKDELKADSSSGAL